MLCCEIRAPGQFGLVQRQMPVIAGDEVLIEPLMVGLCATDRELLDGSMVYLRTGQTSLPLVPGHEWVGRVALAGEAVTALAAGDIVVGECSLGCEQCAICRAGDYHRCESRRETGIMGIDGALSEGLRFPARSAHRVPTEIDIADAVLVEPLAIAVRAIDRLEVSAGDEVLVVGAGIIGTLAIMVLTADVGADVTLAEPDEWRVERARAFGVHPAPPAGTYRRVLEATGHPAGIQRALQSLAPGGRLVCVGLTGQQTVAIDVDGLVVRDQEMCGSLGSPGVWPRTLALLAAGVIQPQSLISHEFPLVEVAAAFDMAGRREPGIGKVVVRPHG